MGLGRAALWSYSRGSLFRSCPRKFFFNYFARGEAFEGAASELRNLISLPALAGIIVDRTISSYFWTISSHLDAPRALVEMGVNAFVSAASGTGTPLLSQLPPFRFHSDRYGYQVGTNAFAGIVDRVQDSLQNFENSAIKERVLELGSSAWLLPSGDGAAPPSFIAFGVRFFAAYDFVFREQNRTYILDWKTGAPSEPAAADADAQLRGYALYLGSLRGTVGQEIHCAPFWLTSRSEPTFKVVNRSEQFAALHAMLDDYQQVEEKGSLNDSEFPPLLELDRAKMPPIPERSKCFFCNFRELCPEGQAIISGEDFDAESVMRINGGSLR